MVQLVSLARDDLTVLSCRVCSAPAMRKFVLKVVEEVAKYKPVRTAR